MKAWQIIVILLNVALIFILARHNISLESKYQNVNSKLDIILNDSIPENKIQKILLDKQFHENYYIEYLNRESNYIIFYVSILFGVFGLVGYALFNKSIEVEVNKIHDKIDISLGSYDKRIKKLESNANSNESRLNITIGNVFSLISEQIKKEADKIFFYNLSAASYFFKAIENCKIDQVQLLESKTKDHLEDCLSYCEKLNSSEIKDLEKMNDNIYAMLNDMFLCKNNEIIGLLSKIRTVYDKKNTHNNN